MKRAVIFFLCIFLSAAAVLASTNGIAGDAITGFFQKVFHMSPEMALAIYSVIFTVIMIVLRVILKKIPGGEEGILGKIVWSILAFIFGSGVRTEGSTDTKMLKEVLSKKYPNMKIEEKDSNQAATANDIVG
jgi:amino acid permease